MSQGRQSKESTSCVQRGPGAFCSTTYAWENCICTPVYGVQHVDCWRLHFFYSCPGRLRKFWPTRVFLGRTCPFLADSYLFCPTSVFLLRSLYQIGAWRHECAEAYCA